MCLIFLLGCDLSFFSTKNADKPFCKQYEGHIGNRPAVLNLMKTGQCDNLLFLGFFYFKDDVKPIFFKGEHFFYPKEGSVSTIMVGNYPVEKSMMDTLKYTSDKIELRSSYGRLRGNFESDSTFVGILKNEKEVLSFDFKEIKSANDLRFDLALSQKDTVLVMGINKNVPVKLTLDLAKPLKTKGLDTALQKAIFKVLTNYEDVIDDSTQINKCLGRAASNRFLEYQTWQASWFRLESVVTPIYNEKNIVSFLCLNRFDTERRDGCRSAVFSYNLEKRQIIAFDDVFKAGSEDKISIGIKKWVKDNNISPNSFDKNRFYLTHKNITFMLSGIEENRYSETGREFTYSFDELKDMIKPTFGAILN